MIFLRTNIPGYFKDKKTNVLINTKADAQAVRENRARFKKQRLLEKSNRAMEDTIRDLLRRVQILESKVQ